MIDYLLTNIERSALTVLLTLAVIAANSYPDTRSFCRSSATLFSTIWWAWSLHSSSYQMFSVVLKFWNFKGQWKTGIYWFFRWALLAAVQLVLRPHPRPIKLVSYRLIAANVGLNSFIFSNFFLYVKKDDHHIMLLISIVSWKTIFVFRFEVTK